MAITVPGPHVLQSGPRVEGMSAEFMDDSQMLISITGIRFDGAAVGGASTGLTKGKWGESD